MENRNIIKIPSSRAIKLFWNNSEPLYRRIEKAMIDLENESKKLTYKILNRL